MQRVAQRQHVRGPAYPLAVIKARVRENRFHVYRTRAIDTIRAALCCERHEARRVAKHIVLALTDADYSTTVQLGDGHLADVYGIALHDAGWYLKLMIDHRLGEVDIISCHLAEHDIHTRRHVVRRGENSP